MEVTSSIKGPGYQEILKYISMPLTVQENQANNTLFFLNDNGKKGAETSNVWEDSNSPKE